MGLNLNRAIIAGNLTRDPEMRQTATGLPVVSFDVAINRNKKNADGTKTQETDFLHCQAWEKKAEFVGRYFKKGDAICVCGSIRPRTFTDNKGEKRTVVEIVAEDVLFAGSKTPTAEQTAPQGYAPAPQTQPMQTYAPPMQQPQQMQMPTAPRYEDIPMGEDLPF